MKKKNKKVNYLDVDVRYTINSSFAISEGYRYRQKIDGIIHYFNDKRSPDKSVEIGKVEVQKILLGQALDAGYSGVSVFDVEHFILDIGNQIYDFERNDFSEAIYENFEVPWMDLLIVSGLEILPEYRGSDIGKFVLRDLYNNFIGGCGLMAIMVYPPQLDGTIPEPGESGYEWYSNMGYAAMEADEEKSIYKLLAYYTSMGFRYIPAISENLLFMAPAKINKIFNKIKLI